MINMEKDILVEGKYTISEFRDILDNQSGIPGLPDMIIHEPEPAALESLSRTRDIFATASLQYGVQNAIDGMVELIPKVVIPSNHK